MKVFESLKKRHSAYDLDKASSLSDAAIINLVKEATLLTPSAYNAQTQRIMILFGKDSDKFWDLTIDALKEVAPVEGFENTVEKLNKFKGQGTLLYFIDMKTVHDLETAHPLYKDNFYGWAKDENAMLQLVIWSALSESGLGANLQHYNPVIDEVVSNRYNVNPDWKLVAQMPFGGTEGEFTLKEKLDIDSRVIIHTK